MRSALATTAVVYSPVNSASGGRYSIGFRNNHLYESPPLGPIASAVAYAVLVGAGAALFLAAFAVPIFLYPTLRPNLPPKASIDFLSYIPAYISGIRLRQLTG